DSRGNPLRQICPRLDAGKQGQRTVVQSHAPPRTPTSDRRSRPPPPPTDAVDQVQGSLSAAALPIAATTCSGLLSNSLNSKTKVARSQGIATEQPFFVLSAAA